MVKKTTSLSCTGLVTAVTLVLHITVIMNGICHIRRKNNLRKKRRKMTECVTIKKGVST